ncbi:hypothetical protein CLG96_06195 [Sphingomonas oleivorans]|uniref:Uncharacterized protein n=1 Tax=Sphingomonas oleivorans TaxID=1735121 RepID=A0A2T5FZL7_9SPHN|nr:hypothetical protein [Sphingomonas oleivorans]PTQ12146.1 hypothetical protein CLG96_06195 [Sphingomonas oleivorans]
MKRIRVATAAAVGAMMAMAWPPTPARAQDDGCAVAAKPKKKRGLGGLLSAARSSGLEGSIAGALRGDGDLKSDLGGVARATAERGAADAGARAACAATDRASGGGEDGTGTRPAAPASATGRARRETAAADVQYPSRMPVADTIKAQIAAFDAFGKVRCASCEGGHAYESWARQAYVSELRGEYNGWAKKLGNLAVGATLPWTSGSAAGVITVRSEGAVNGFRCKQLHYRLTRGSASAERPGLVCWGRLNEYAGSDSWVEVY